MESETSKRPPERLIQLAGNNLTRRDFNISRKYALMVRETNPDLLQPNQILAIADVLLAADRRLADNRVDYYSILQISKTDPDVHAVVRSQFKKLVTLLNPSKNKFAFCKEAFDHVCNAWTVLSKEDKKRNYDIEIGNLTVGNNQNLPKSWPEMEPCSGGDSDGDAGIETLTFWTVCPYCYGVYMYEKVYKECCLACQNCRKPFTALEIQPPPKEAIVKGKEQYYCAVGFCKLGYDRDGFADKKTSGGNSKAFNSVNVVEVSDDSDDGEKKEVREPVVKRHKRVKSLAKKKKWNRTTPSMPLSSSEEESAEEGTSGNDVDSEFFEGVDDMIAGLKEKGF